MGEDCRTPCNRCGCIIVYKGKKCALCGPAEDMLRKAAYALGVPNKAFCVIDIDRLTLDMTYDAVASEIPRILICDKHMYGFPDDDLLQSALLTMLSVRNCFYTYTEDEV